MPGSQDDRRWEKMQGRSRNRTKSRKSTRGGKHSCTSSGNGWGNATTCDRGTGHAQKETTGGPPMGGGKSLGRPRVGKLQDLAEGGEASFEPWSSDFPGEGKTQAPGQSLDKGKLPMGAHCSRRVGSKQCKGWGKGLTIRRRGRICQASHGGRRRVIAPARKGLVKRETQRC